MNIKTHGRTDLEAFFTKSGVLRGKLVHNPILVFFDTFDDEGSPIIDVMVFDEALLAVNLLASDTTPCMAQWPGKYRSDFFKFTLGDLRKAYNDHLL